METFSALLSLCEGNLQVTVVFPHKGDAIALIIMSLLWHKNFARPMNGDGVKAICDRLDVNAGVILSF